MQCLGQGSIVSWLDIQVNCLHVYMYLLILCVWRASGAMPRPRLQGLIMGNAHASVSWFDILSWLISIYTDMFVLKLCVLSAIWAMCTGLGLNGLMFLPWHIYVCVCIGVTHGQCASLRFMVWCSVMDYTFMYIYVCTEVVCMEFFMGNMQASASRFNVLPRIICIGVVYEVSHALCWDLSFMVWCSMMVYWIYLW